MRKYICPKCGNIFNFLGYSKGGDELWKCHFCFEIYQKSNKNEIWYIFTVPSTDPWKILHGDNIPKISNTWRIS